MPSSLNLDPVVRAQLTETARALYERNETAAHQTVQQLSPALQNTIYFKLWQAAGSPTQETRPDIAHADFGRLAFFSQEGRTATLQQKIGAVETVLTDLIEEALRNQQPASEGTPLDGERVQLNCFYDCGFDPRFSEDGNVYLTQPKSSWTDCIKIIQEVVATILFTLKAYLSCNSEERNLRQLILSSEKLERQCSRYAYDGQVAASYDGYSIGLFPTAEHDLFEKLSSLFKAIHPDEAHPPRLFPSELLHSIHAINKPQTQTWDADRASPPPWDNGDLDRSARWGLFRLCSGVYENPTRLDRFENNYVPHYIFIHAIKASSAELKSACRSLRTALSEITTDMSSATSLDACKERITPQIERLKACWDRYVQSHELLTEVQPVFSQTDHFAKTYEVHRWESYIPSFLMDSYREYCCANYGASHHFSDHASQQGYDSMKAAFEGPLSQTRTGRFLAAREQETHT